MSRKIAALLDTQMQYDSTVAMLSSAPGSPLETPAVQRIALQRADGKWFDDTQDLAVIAGWGHAGKGGVAMPGRGRLV